MWKKFPLGTEKSGAFLKFNHYTLSVNRLQIDYSAVKNICKLIR